MNVAEVGELPAEARERARFAGSMLFWTGGQALAIVFVALRIPLSANFPLDGERTATYTVAIAQIFLTVGLLGRLTIGQALLLAAAALPFSAIAMILDSLSPRVAAICWALSMASEIATYAVSHFLPPTAQKSFRAAVFAVSVTLCIAAYLRVDQ